MHVKFDVSQMGDIVGLEIRQKSATADSQRETEYIDTHTRLAIEAVDTLHVKDTEEASQRAVDIRTYRTQRNITLEVQNYGYIRRLDDISKIQNLGYVDDTTESGFETGIKKRPTLAPKPTSAMGPPAPS